MENMNWKVYQKPKHLAEASAMLAQAAGRGRVIAGAKER
jgi:CO/xanthine dehydrogenase FAD-binding subunit